MTNRTCAKIKKNHDTCSPLAKFCNEKSWNKKLSYRNLSTLAPSLNGNLAVISTLYKQINNGISKWFEQRNLRNNPSHFIEHGSGKEGLDNLRASEAWKADVRGTQVSLKKHSG